MWDSQANVVTKHGQYPLLWQIPITMVNTPMPVNTCYHGNAHYYGQYTSQRSIVMVNIQLLCSIHIHHGPCPLLVNEHFHGQ